MPKFRLFFFVWVLLCSISLYAEFKHPDIISFEEGVEPAVATRGANKLTTSTAHFKHGEQSLQWSWKANASAISIHEDIPYVKRSLSDDNKLYTFLFWIYLEEPLRDSLRFEFFKEGQLCCWCCYGLDFTGWRSAWMAFDRDMQGTPQEGMDELRIAAPASAKKGTIFFDHIILASLQDGRHHTPDKQAPYINSGSKDVYVSMYDNWTKDFEYPAPKTVSAQNRMDVMAISKRIEDAYVGNKRVPMPKLREQFRAFNLTKTTGKPVFSAQLDEVYDCFKRSSSSRPQTDNSLQTVSDFLFTLAQSYYNVDTEDEQKEIAEMFIPLVRYLLDQGYQAGSANGTLCNIGASLHNYFPALFLMREPLRKAGLLDECQQAMEWFSGAGEMKRRPKEAGADIEVVSTLLEGRLMSILMMSDTLAQIRYLNAMSSWMDNAFAFSNGLSDGFKPDGTVFHHFRHDPQAAVEAFSAAVNMTAFLQNTRWTLSRESRTTLKKALLAMRIYCNEQDWPISLSGAHPEIQGHLLPEHFKRLAQCGTPNGKSRIDKELQDAVFMRPTGSYAFPYACLLVQRQDNWMASVKGFNRYICGTQILDRANVFGRYMNYGSLFILGAGNPVSNIESGYTTHGFDWNHWPGTTANVLPFERLRARVRNVDNVSGCEEMLLSDESFCGQVALENDGMFGMKLHGHDKYDGSFRARKSVFFFNNLIVCLGTNIHSEEPYMTHTTLYQVAMPDDAASLPKCPKGLLTDYYGNYYVLRNPAKMYKVDGLQRSCDPVTGQPVAADFHLAAISHGEMPEDASYEYAILVQPNISQVNDLTREEVLRSYEVLRADSAAHVVYDVATGATCYVLFEAEAELANSLPCLVMTLPSSDDSSMQLAVSDPDMHLYEGPADEVFDEDGLRKERSIASRTWKYNMSQPSTLTLLVPGHWQHVGQEGVSARIEGDSTLLTIILEEALAKTVSLTKVD